MKLIIGLILVCLVVAVLAANTAQAVEWSIQSSVQPMKCSDIAHDSLAAGDTVVIHFSPPLYEATFTTSFACSVITWSSESCVDDSTYMPFNRDEAFQLPALLIDSVGVVSREASMTGEWRIWGWRR